MNEQDKSLFKWDANADESDFLSQLWQEALEQETSQLPLSSEFPLSI